jgi:hypothetical protein
MMSVVLLLIEALSQGWKGHPDWVNQQGITPVTKEEAIKLMCEMHGQLNSINMKEVTTYVSVDPHQGCLKEGVKRFIAVIVFLGFVESRLMAIESVLDGGDFYKCRAYWREVEVKVGDMKRHAESALEFALTARATGGGGVGMSGCG